MKRFAFVAFSMLLSVGALAQVAFPTGPRDFEAISKWGYTTAGTSWNTSKYLPFIYRDMWFRMMPPNAVTYNSAANTFTNTVPGQKYPAILFFHGAGETGTDNNKQLIHGGQTHMNAVTNNNFPGFLIYPQNVAGGDDKGGALIRKLLASLPIDPNRIYVHGLSNGAKWSWDFLLNNPELVAAAAPMSGVLGELVDTEDLLYTPLRLAQGGLDSNPAPGFTQTIVDWYNEQGGHLEYFLYPNLGHGTWNTMYARSDFFTWFLSKQKNQIQVRYNRNEICPGSPINVDMGFSPDFLGYEWYKDGVLIQGATQHKIIVHEYGSYTGKVRFLDGTWSAMSAPMLVKAKAVTATPSITNTALRSNVLPAPDGSITTSLELPAGYVSYSWKDVNTNAIVSTERVFPNASVGSYTATVTEVNGCSSVPSPVFNVVSTNGANKPDPVNGVIGFAPSQTQIVLTWTQNPEPTFNETAFEVYRATSISGPYELIAMTAADATGYTNNGLDANQHYFYKIRPVNATSAAVASDPIDVLTQLDAIAPTTPTNLAVSTSTSNSVTLTWSASTDNVGVERYNIYLNGALAKTSTDVTTTVFSLTPNTVYNFTIRAVDLTGNVSPLSNQVTAPTIQKGLNWRYYEGTWANLPDFNTLTPVKIGTSKNVDINIRNRNENFAIYWEGYIYIPVAGNYTFYTNSDDGSKLYIGGYGAEFQLVNNDGGHGMQYREGTKNLTAGSHKIVITYFQGAGGYGMEAHWNNTAHGITTRQLIPDVQFTEAFTMPGNTPPAPTNLAATAASYNQINLTWTDASQTETGFQIYRATANDGPYSVVATVGANTTSYADVGLNPSTNYFYRIQAIGQYGASGFSTDKILGLNYSYYEQTFNALVPAIDSSIPKKTGTVSNVSLAPRDRDTQFGFKFEGKIIIPMTGNYTFYLSADDNARMSIDNTGLTSDGGTSERSFVMNGLTAGKHNIKVIMRQATGSSRCEVRWQRAAQSSQGIPALAKQLIPNTAFNETQVNATTLQLPPAPAAPTDLVASNEPDKMIRLTWTDNSSDETSFELHRSVSNPNSFVVYKTLNANQTSYEDTGLFPRVTYYYKIVAKNVGGGTPSNTVNATVPNTAPAFSSEIPNFTVRFGEERLIPITVDEPDGDFVIINGLELPEVAQLFDNGDGTGGLFVLATEAQQGVYENLKIVARDNFGGSDTLTFNITVNSNHNPVISAINPVNLKESYVSTFSINAEDLDGETVQWEFENLPSFVVAVANGNTLNFTVSPLIQHAGSYNVLVTARDGQGGSDTEILPITVTDYNPNFSIWLNITTNAGPQAPSPWVNLRTNTSSASPIVWTGGNNLNLINELGIATGIGVVFENGWNNILTSGGVTPGLYPDNVMLTHLRSNTSGARTIRVSGLNPNGKYTLKFMSSQQDISPTGSKESSFTANGQTVTLQGRSNAMNTADLVNLVPNASGELVVSINRINGATYSILNALVITSVYEGTSIPATPTDLTSSVTGDSKIQLNWTDNAFDETAYEVYESTDNTNFTKIATLGFDVHSYVDPTFNGAETYYYKVRAVNNFGPSEYSNVLDVVGPNRPPVIAAIPPFNVTEMDYKVLTVTATDPDGDLVNFTLENEPYFMWKEEPDFGVADLVFTPQGNDQGTYQFNIIAHDTHGLTSSAVVNVTVSRFGEVEMKVNFTDNNAARLAAAPWANLFTNVINTTLNLKDATNSPTTVNMKLVNAWSGINVAGGYQSPDNTGVFPNASMASSFIISDNNARTLQFTGLKTDRVYDFTFFSSRIEGASTTPARNTVFTIGSKTVTVNSLGNQSNLVKLIGIKPDATGTVNLSVSRQSGSTFGYLNAMTIREYQGSGLPNAPSALTAQVVNRSTVKLTWTDNSEDETSFRVWRAGSDLVYSEIANLGANVTSFTNNNLAPGTQYFYRVRAVNNAGFTESDPVEVSTFDYSVSLNFNAFNGGPTDWNNFAVADRFITPGSEFPNLYDEFRVNTGIMMTVEQPFTGDNPWGVNTGSNSGILPDRVMEGSYWVDPGVVAVLKFSNLTFLKRYSFNFFASRDGAGNRNTVYTIGGQSVVLNAALNSTQMVQINNVVPALDGTITVSIQAQAGALFGYLNGLIIQAAPNPNPPARMASDESGLGETDAPNILQRAVASPNPFTNSIRVTLDQPQSGVRALLYNSVGQKVAEAFVNSEEELYDFEMQVDSELPAGIYILKLHDSVSSAAHKLMKR